MPSKEHLARLRNTSLFVKESMRSKNIAKGVRIIVGELKDKDGMATQTYRFNKSSFTSEQAKEWLFNNNIKYNKFEEATEAIQSFEREIKLQCTSLALHPQEIKNNIPINVLNEIKNKNTTPYFKAYSIMQDGIAKPRVIGESNSLPTKWSKKIVESLNGIIKRGVQFFIGHNADNSTDGRKSIGEVIANFQKQIGDKLHDIVIGYFPDKLEADKYDVCSIEGNILSQDYDNYSIVKSIKNITGIALGNSAYDKPAFPGAVCLGAIQAFGDNAKDEIQPPKINKSEEITMNFEEIKNAVKAMNIFPAQLYTEDDLKQDRVFGKIFDEVETVKKEKNNIESQLTEKDDIIKKLNKDIAITGSQEKLIKLFPEGLTDSQKTFISKKFNPESIEDLAEEKINEFITKSLTEFSEYASMFNDSKKEPQTTEQFNSSEEEDDIDKIVNEVIKQPQGE